MLLCRRGRIAENNKLIIHIRKIYKMTRRKDPQTPGNDALYFLPLGGVGEIGGNLNLYGTNGKWLMVDLGIAFGDDTMPGIDLLMPDIRFIEERKDDLVGLVLTHGHEDHLGAIEYLWPRLQCPIYATPFAATLLRAKLAESPMRGKVRIIEVPPSGNFEIGPFAVQLISVAHSIPEAHMLAIRTSHGTVLHTGDWKIDNKPLLGPKTDEAALRKLGEEGVMALMGDSTNALTPGHSGSELSAREGLTEVIGNYSQRIIVTCFASNIVRLLSIAHAAHKHGRQVALVGRSLWRIVETARSCGYLPKNISFLTGSEASFVPRDKILIIATGSQGEQRSALSRLADGDHPELTLDHSDVVIFSSRAIPGNERAIARVHNALVRIGVDVVTWREAPIHVSGHPCQDELATLYSWVKPRIAIPVHGELRHQTEHAKIAENCGVPLTMIAETGSIIRISGDTAEVVGEVPHGKMVLDGKSLRPLGGTQCAVRDRRKLGQNGAAVITLVMDYKGKLLREPQIAMIGVLEDESSEDLLFEAAEEVRSAIEEMPKSMRIDDQAVRTLAGQALRRTMNRIQGKKPMTEVHLVRV